MLQPKTKYSEENVDLVVTDDQKVFNSLEELANHFEQPLLLPYDIESEMINLMILLDDYGDFKHVTISFDYKSVSCFYDIEYPISSSIVSPSYNNKIGEYDVMENEYDGKTQIVWYNTGIHYCAQSENSEIIKSIVYNVRFK